MIVVIFGNKNVFVKTYQSDADVAEYRCHPAVQMIGFTAACFLLGFYGKVRSIPAVQSADA